MIILQNTCHVCYNGAKLWNGLPDDIKDVNTKENFEQKFNQICNSKNISTHEYSQNDVRNINQRCKRKR